MKTVCNIIMAVGIILALGVVGTSDLEAAAGLQLITTGQLIIRLALSALLVFAGYYGNRHFVGRPTLVSPESHTVYCKNDKNTACI